MHDVHASPILGHAVIHQRCEAPTPPVSTMCRDLLYAFRTTCCNTRKTSHIESRHIRVRYFPTSFMLRHCTTQFTRLSHCAESEGLHVAMVWCEALRRSVLVSSTMWVSCAQVGTMLFHGLLLDMGWSEQAF